MSAISCILVALISIQFILFCAMICLNLLYFKEADKEMKLTRIAADECLKRGILPDEFF